MRKHMTPENAIIGILALAVLIGLFSVKAKAQEVEIAVMTGYGGLLCNNTSEVTDVLEAIDSGTDHETAITAVPGCGILQMPQRMRIVSLGEYQTEKAKYLLVRYEFLDAPIPNQYGFHARALRGASM